MASTQIQWRTDVENAPTDTELLVTVRYRGSGISHEPFVKDAMRASGDHPWTSPGWHYHYDNQWYSIEGFVIAWAYPIAPYDGDVPKKEKP